ncbi:hypothetical protein NC651_025930 [Populus alba x Populus x berolinensis]|nr:hypothetical protein NC651_025930 [Populus alba x Populus x berolinensis]
MKGELFECSYPGFDKEFFMTGKHSLLLIEGSLHKRMHSLTMSFANSSIIRDHLLVCYIDRLIRLNLDSWSDRVFLMEEAKKLMSFDPCEWNESLKKEKSYVLAFSVLPLPIFSPNLPAELSIARTKVWAASLSLVVKQGRLEMCVGEGGKERDMLEALVASDDHGSFSDDKIVICLSRAMELHLLGHDSCC